MWDLVLRGGHLLDNPAPVDVAIAEGKIAAIAPQLEGSGATELDAEGLMLSPPLVESHVHLDSVLTAGEPRWNESGTLFEGIQIWGERKQSLTLEEVKQRAIAMLQQQAMQGTLFVRTHADVSESQLIALQALLEVREEVRDWITVQVVAFPQDGVYSRPENEALLEQAIAMGADAVGGIPHFELTREDGARSVERIFELAQTYDRLIDLHCDEIDDDQSRFLEVVAACAIRTGTGPRVTASHATAFGSYNNAYAYKLLGFLQRSQINIIANPLINITLQGRADTYPKRRGITRVKELWQHNVNVSFGHDCILDPWYNLGTGNLLDVAHMGIHVCQMTGRAEVAACYEMVSTGGAKTLHLDADYGISVGNPANLIAFAGSDRFDILRRRPLPRYVISRGKLLARTSAVRTDWILSEDSSPK